jgi:hypothetical protein
LHRLLRNCSIFRQVPVVSLHFTTGSFPGTPSACRPQDTFLSIFLAYLGRAFRKTASLKKSRNALTASGAFPDLTRFFAPARNVRGASGDSVSIETDALA